MRRTDPSLSARKSKWPHRGHLLFWRVEVWTNPLWVRQNRRERFWTAELAPEARSAGGVSLRDETNRSLPLRQEKQMAPSGSFAFLESGGVDEPSVGSTKSPGAILDSGAGPGGAKRRRGESQG